MKINPQLQSVLENLGNGAGSDSKALIVSAYQLSDDELKAIVDKFDELKGKEVANAVEPDLVGGFIIKFGSKLIDLSIASQLQSVKQKLYEE